jgi:hypothetical protein
MFPMESMVVFITALERLQVIENGHKNPIADKNKIL